MKNILTLIILLLGSSAAQENQKYININGTSELTIPADQINFTVYIRVIAESVEESKKNNDKYFTELLNILETSGIVSKDIQVSPLTLGKNYEYADGRERVQNGFFTQVNVSFLLKDLTKYFELTNRLAANNNFEMSSSYSISDYELKHETTYVNALKAAKEKAEYMAIAMGLKLGEVLEIDENDISPLYPNPFNTSTVINPQDDRISGNVTIKRSIRVKFSIN